MSTTDALHLEDADPGLLPLPAAVGLVALEDVRQRLARAADELLVHLEQRHAEPGADH